MTTDPRISPWDALQTVVGRRERASGRSFEDGPVPLDREDERLIVVGLHVDSNQLGLMTEDITNSVLGSFHEAATDDHDRNIAMLRGLLKTALHDCFLAGVIYERERDQ
jgi:hypothetical protein